MKEICILTNTLKSGGAEKQSVLLANLLSDFYIVRLIVIRGNQCDFKLLELIDKNVTLICLKGSVFSKYKYLRLLIYYNKNLIIFSSLLLPNMINGILSIFFRTYISVGGIRSSYIEPRKLLFNWINVKYLNHYTIFNNYRGYEKYAVRLFRSKRGIVIPNAVSIPQSFSQRSIKKIPVILSVGRFDKSKDYYTALLSVKSLADSNISFKYIIIGWGCLESQIRLWVKELNLGSYVEIIVNPNNLGKLYQNSDIFLQTSIFEGLSNTVLEAMSFGLPLVLTNVGDNEMLLRSGANGFLHHTKDIMGISSSLAFLIESPTQRMKHGHISYQTVKANYSKERMQLRYLKFIEAIDERFKSKI